MSSNFAANVELAYTSIEEAFPKVEPEIEPLGSRVLFQIKRAIKRTKSGIWLADETVETEDANTQVAKVIAMGPLAFHSRNTGEPWPEGAWVKVGDYARVPKFGGDSWTVRLTELIGGKPVHSEIKFRMFNDLEILGKVTGDPLKVNAYA
jgi:co-chaperonin GroES (HSP10)